MPTTSTGNTQQRRHRSERCDPASYGVAVLLVHGIGAQKRGETLAGFGGPLVASVRSLFGEASVADIDCATAHDPDAPEHRALSVERPGSEPLRVLLAESLWADQVEAPDWLALLEWLVDTVPYAIGATLLTRATRRMDHAFTRFGRVMHSVMRMILNVLASGLIALLMILLVALGLLAWSPTVRARAADARRRLFPRWMICASVVGVGLVGFGLGATDDIVATALLCVLAVPPVVVLLTLSRHAQSVLIDFIGDSYALQHDEASRQRIVDQVQADLRWVERCASGAPVVVVAHSQGADVVRIVLSQRTAEGPIAGLVTFGAGIEKLWKTAMLRGRKRHARTAAALRLLSAVCVILAAVASVRWGGMLGPCLAAVLTAIAALTLTSARWTSMRVLGVMDRAVFGIDEHHVAYWTDFHASHDPVSGGDLPVGQCTRGHSRTIVNRGSYLLDHSSYWQNVEGFQLAVALEVARAADGLPEPARPAVLVAAERARSTTIRRLRVARHATSLLVVMLWLWLAPGFVIAAAITAVAVGVYGLAARRSYARLAQRAALLGMALGTRPRASPPR